MLYNRKVICSILIFFLVPFFLIVFLSLQIQKGDLLYYKANYQGININEMSPNFYFGNSKENKEATLEYFRESLGTTEPGLLIIENIFKKLNTDWESFLIISNFLFLSLSYSLIKNYRNNNNIIFFTPMLFYSQILCAAAFRLQWALVIFMTALLLKEKKNIKILLYFSSILVHIQIALLIFSFEYLKKSSKKFNLYETISQIIIFLAILFLLRHHIAEKFYAYFHFAKLNWLAGVKFFILALILKPFFIQAHVTKSRFNLISFIFFTLSLLIDTNRLNILFIFLFYSLLYIYKINIKFNALNTSLFCYFFIKFTLNLISIINFGHIL